MMQVFLSWSGPTSNFLAQLLQENLQPAIQAAKFWMSHTDIEPGQRWSEEIATKLSDSNFGIICITKQNVSAPWILFEAGALSKELKAGKVIPLLYDMDITDVPPPLAQFQAKKWNRQDIYSICVSINSETNVPLSEKVLQNGFNAHWRQIEEKITGAPVSSISGRSRPLPEILEELVQSSRSVERAFAGQLKKDSSYSKVNLRTLGTIGVSVKDGTDWDALLLVSAVKEEVPWLYEAVFEIVKVRTSGNNTLFDEKLNTLFASLDVYEYVLKNGIIERNETHAYVLTELKRYKTDFIPF